MVPNPMDGFLALIHSQEFCEIVCIQESYQQLLLVEHSNKEKESEMVYLIKPFFINGHILILLDYYHNIFYSTLMLLEIL